MGKRNRRRTWTAALLAAAVVVVGCSGADDAVESMDAPGIAEPTAERDLAFDYDEGVSPPISPPRPSAPTGRHVIRSAQVEIQTGDTEAAVDRVVGIAERFGGYAATLDVSRDRSGVVTGWVTLRVPADRLEEVVAEIERVGDVVPRSRIDEFDVTMELVDIEARLGNLEVFEAELLELLAEVREGSPDAEQLVIVFERIREVRAEIDQLRARQKALSDQVDMATVSVGIHQRPATGDVSWSPSRTLSDAAAATVRLLTRVGDGVIWAVVTVLPIAVAVLALPAAVVGWWWRRRRRNRTPST